jgi:hypothetical protein
MTTSTQALLDSIANFDARVKAKLDLKLDTSGTAAKATVLESLVMVLPQVHSMAPPV